MIHTLSVRTHHRTEMVDITGQIQALVRDSGVEEGVCHIFAGPHHRGPDHQRKRRPQRAVRHPHGLE